MGCFGSKTSDTQLRKLETYSLHKSHISPSIISASINKFYVFEERIGRGHYGEVFLAHPIDDKNKKFAVKTISKRVLASENNLKYLKFEIEVLQTLDHPNIIKLYETYDDDSGIHLVTEYCSGGKLLERIKEKHKFSESDTAFVIIRILRALKYLHEKGICHRDVKPENFLYETDEEESDIKLIDFGLSHQVVSKVQRMKSTVGTLAYVAPEVLKGNYSSKCDM